MLTQMDAAKADLMRALGRLVRGLSILFWCIPLTLAADVESAQSHWLDDLGAFSFVPAFLLSGALWFGLRLLRDFQKQERVWQWALDRAGMLALINTGLAPFLFWWHRFPKIHFYFVCVNVLAVSGYLFLMQLNEVLRRLAAMLPDEMLRMESRTFTSFNTWMLACALAALAAYFVWTDFQGAPRVLGHHLVDFQTIGEWLVLFMTLMPTAVTLALLWKLKEAIFTSLIEVER